jgi:hypothetical protein
MNQRPGSISAGAFAMAAIRIDRHAIVGANPTARRRVGLFAAAVVTAWMTATIIAVVAVMIGAAPATSVTALTVVVTAGLAALLYRHFCHLGHIDEPLVLGLLFSWAVTLGLLSL